jgi:hypothetical protein
MLFRSRCQPLHRALPLATASGRPRCCSCPPWARQGRSPACIGCPLVHPEIRCHCNTLQEKGGD